MERILVATLEDLQQQCHKKIISLNVITYVLWSILVSNDELSFDEKVRTFSSCGGWRWSRNFIARYPQFKNHKGRQCITTKLARKCQPEILLDYVRLIAQQFSLLQIHTYLARHKTEPLPSREVEIK